MTAIGLHHPLDGVTNPEYKLLRFMQLNFLLREEGTIAFNRDRCCHLVLCLQLILFHWMAYTSLPTPRVEKLGQVFILLASSFFARLSITKEKQVLWGWHLESSVGEVHGHGELVPRQGPVAVDVRQVPDLAQDVGWKFRAHQNLPDLEEARARSVKFLHKNRRKSWIWCGLV